MNLTEQELLQRYNDLSAPEKAALLAGISLEAAMVIKKLLGDHPLGDRLIFLKKNFPL